MVVCSSILIGGNLFAEETGQDTEEPEQQEEPVDLAAQARDPTAPVTAFAIRYDFITDFHNLPGANQQQLVLQPIIPWKWGNTTHISRVTLPYIVSAPDGSPVVPVIPDPGYPPPPGYVPTADVTGLADTSLVDLMVSGTSWGRQGFGAGLVIPTASDPALGTEKWSIGPAYVAMTSVGGLQLGALGQWLVSFAGKSDRNDVNTLTIQPFASYGLKNNWSIASSFMAFNYDIENSRWTSLPVGLRVEKLVKLGPWNARVFVEYEYNFADDVVAPKNIIRFAIVPLL